MQLITSYFVNDQSSPDMNIVATGLEPAEGPTEFIIKPPVGEVWNIRSIVLTMTSLAMDYINTFGGIAGPLTNGILIEARREGVTSLDITAGLPVKRNRELLALFGTPPAGILENANPAIADVLRGTIDIQALTGFPVVLNGTEVDSLVIRVQDNLSTIQFLRARAYGTNG